VLAALALAVGCERAPPGAAPAPAATPAPPAPPEAERPAAAPPARRRGDRHARAAARQSRLVKVVEGTVARAGARQVVIRPRGAAAVTLRVVPGTRVTLDGKPARAAALREGAEVRASYQAGGDTRPTALSIEARAPPDGGEAEAPVPLPVPEPEPSGG
jgi:hypothetical protein